MSSRSLGVRNGHRSEGSTSVPRFQCRSNLQSANTGATSRSSGNKVACAVLYQYLKAKQQARASGVCLSRVRQPMERICDERSMSSPAFNVPNDAECRAIPAKRPHEVISMAPVSYQRNMCRGLPSSTACYEEMHSFGDMQPSVEALKLDGRAQPAVTVSAAQECHTSGNVSTIVPRTVPRSERIRLLSRYRRRDSPDRRGRHTGGGDATAGDRYAINGAAGASKPPSTCPPSDGEIVARVCPSVGADCSAFTVSTAGDHTALTDVSAISSADLSDSHISINTSCIWSLVSPHTADTLMVSSSGVTRSSCNSSAFSSGVAESANYIELLSKCSEVPAYPLPSKPSYTLPPEECPRSALRRVDGTPPISPTNQTVRKPPETLSATSSTAGASTGASMSVVHDILEAHNFASVGNSTTSCSTMFTCKSDLRRNVHSELSFRFPNSDKIQSTSCMISEQYVKSEDRASQQSVDRVSQQSVDRVSQQSVDRVSQQSGDRVSQQSVGHVSLQSGDRVSQQSGDRVSQQSVGHASLQSGDHVSQQSGDRVSQQSVDRVSQQSGDRISQQSVDRVSQQSVDHVSQQSVDHVSQQSGDRVSQQSVKSGDHISQQSGDRVSQQSGDHVSQQSGDRVSQQSGDHVSQQSGDRVSQQSVKSGDHVSQQSGDHVSQQSGDRVSQQSGDRVSQQSGDRVSQQSVKSVDGGSEFVNPERSSALVNDTCGAESALAVVRSERDALQLELGRLKRALLETGRHLEVRVQQVARLSQQLEAARSAEQLSNGKVQQLEEQLRRSASTVSLLQSYIVWLRSSYSRLFGARVPEMPLLLSSSS